MSEELTTIHHDFSILKNAIAQQFDKMCENNLFRTKIERDDIWEAYLKSFPAGSNPVYRVRTEHDCGCCRHFIKNMGNVVAIVDNELVSIWDGTIGDDPTYKIVAKRLSMLVKSKPVDNIFLSSEKKVGTDKSFEDRPDGVKTWEHLFVNVPNKFVAPNKNIATCLSDARSSFDVLFRSLSEITNDSISTVLELIAQNSIYRGEEHNGLVTSFQKLKREFNKLTHERNLFVWSMILESSGSISRFRNTAIGTLLVDLSNGVELEDAVRMYESKVAPQNYKRPTALITKSMIESARKEIEELGLTDSLERRYAKLTDISINNVLFASSKTKNIINKNVFDELISTTPAKKGNLSKVEEIAIDKFITDIIPRITSMEILFESQHTNNLVSLIAPVNPDSARLFKWKNKFSWTYNGDMTDSIKERVKRAGGSVSGDVCCRLAWSNYDDLDLHMKEPGGYEIYFLNKGIRSPNGGYLDVDMNARRGITREPVENIYYPARDSMRSGLYKLMVHNYCQRERTDVGFEVEVDLLGKIHRFEYNNIVRTNEIVQVLDFNYSNNKIEIVSSLPSKPRSKSVWGIQTEAFHNVNALMLSPNYWDGNGLGNKHYFFMLDECKNDGRARGFFNEFLMDKLTPHRKVIEIVGNKMRIEESDDQLSGLGFSSTRHDEVIVKVTGSFTRTLKLVF